MSHDPIRPHPQFEPRFPWALIIFLTFLTLALSYAGIRGVLKALSHCFT